MLNSIAQNQMVACGGLDCSICSFLSSIQSIINFLLGVAAAVAVIAVIFAGFAYLLHAGDVKLMNKGKAFLKYSISGFVVVLVSFWVFNAAYMTLGAKDKSSWFKVDCVQERTFTEKENQNQTGKQTAWTNNLGLAIVGGSSIQGAVNDTQKIIKLDLPNFDANNLLLDVLKLNPGQVIKFISIDISAGPAEIIQYVNGQKGYSTEAGETARGDRTAGNHLEKEVLEIKMGGLGAISASGGGQEIVVDTGNSDKMKKFQEFLKNALDQIEAKNQDIYAFNGTNQEAYSWSDQESCENNGGSWKSFVNECEARKAVCGQENLKCTQTKNELPGCQCPENSCLRFGKCAKLTASSDESNSSDSDGDSVPDISDYCPKTPKGEKVDKSSTSDAKGCSCSQVTLQTRECPATRCEGSNLVKYAGSVKDKCLNGKIIKDPCNPTGIEYNQQCNELKNVSQINNIKPIANQNATQNWQNNLSKAIGGNSNIPHPNDSLNNFEKGGRDEEGSNTSSGSGPGGQDSTGTGQSPTGTGTDTGAGTGRTNNDTTSGSGGSEEAHALEQGLTKIPEGILANNRGVTPYMAAECIPKLQQAAVELDKIRPGWKIYPSSIFRSDQKQTRMWNNSSKNTKWIARPISAGGGGSGHSFGTAGDLKFQDANRRVIDMSSGDKALLRQIMINAGMVPYDAEWWHFYFSKNFRPPEHRPRV